MLTGLSVSTRGEPRHAVTPSDSGEARKERLSFHPPSTTPALDTSAQVRGSGGHLPRLAARRVHVGRGRPRAQRDPAPETRVPPRGLGGPALALLLGLGAQQRRKLDGR